MFSSNEKISVRQLCILLILNLTATGLITLPSRVTEYSGEDAWIAVLLATLLMLISAYLLCSAAAKAGDRSFFGQLSYLFSKPVAVIISVVFSARLILMAASELRAFCEIIRLTLLFNTPGYVVGLAALLLAAYAASRGYESRARLGEILIFIAFVPLFVILALAAVQVDHSNLLPVLYSSPEELARGSHAAIFAFAGLELCLIAYPYINKKKKARRPILITVAAIGIFMAIITALATARFGAAETSETRHSVLVMLDTVNLPGSFIERQDAIVMTFWIISSFALLNACLFFSSLLIKDVNASAIKQGSVILLLVPVILILSLLPEDIEKITRLPGFVSNSFLAFFCFVLPALMLIASRLKRGK